MSKLQLRRTRHPLDVHIGQKLRMRRTILGMNQSDVGEMIGVTFQQVQKYERGVNRIAASTLWQLSNAMGVAPNYFFDDFRDREEA